MPCKITFPGVSPLQFEVPSEHCSNGSKAKEYLANAYDMKLPPANYYLVHDGLSVSDSSPLQSGATYGACIRLCGGKGGFGSMLRAMGSQIEKTTNTESCRDLSGRRMRDVNNEKKVLEYMKNKAANDREKERKKLENLEKKLEKPKHYFNDPEYEAQIELNSKKVDDSIKKGMLAKKRKQELEAASKPKKVRPSIFDDLSSDDDDSSSSDDNDDVTTTVMKTSVKRDGEAGCSSSSTTNSEDDCKSNASK